jgi:hypothetical protein
MFVDVSYVRGVYTCTVLSRTTAHYRKIQLLTVPEDDEEEQPACFMTALRCAVDLLIGRSVGRSVELCCPITTEDGGCDGVTA